MGVIMGALSALGGAAGSVAGAVGSGITSGTAALNGLKGAASGALNNAFGADNVSAVSDMVSKVDRLGGGSGPAAPSLPAPTSSGLNIQSAPSVGGGGTLGVGNSPEDLKRKTRGGLFS